MFCIATRQLEELVIEFAIVKVSVDCTQRHLKLASRRSDHNKYRRHSIKMDINELLALANQGDRGAQRVLEKTLGQPEGMYTQMVEATQKSIEGAKLGDVASMRYLGQAYYMGLGIEKNYDLAKLWLERAVEKNDSTAMFHLGQMYAAVYDEYDKSEDLINKAVKIGPIVGVTQDEIDHTLEAIALFAKTAKRGQLL